MLEIIIPTLGRCDNQITLSSLPDKWKKKTTLVVQEHEYDYMLSKYGSICSVWKLPPGTKGIAWTRKHIADNWKSKNIFVMDDDLKFVQLKPSGEKFVGSNPTEEEFDFVMSEVLRHMSEGIVHGGFTVNNTPPVDTPYNYNSRIWTNVFYSKDFPVDQINFGTDYVLMPEDFYVNLQLLTKGYKNVLFNHFRVSPSATNAKGGCAEFRTIENHNRGQEILAELFPQFVTVTSKVQSTGPWAGKEKKALSVQWKKAFDSSQQSSLDAFL